MADRKKSMTRREKDMRAKAKKELQAKGVFPPTAANRRITKHDQEPGL